LAEAGVDIVVWRWLEAERYAGRELFEITLSAEVGAGCTKGYTCPAEESLLIYNSIGISNSTAKW
jgi:hypothetical protein